MLDVVSSTPIFDAIQASFLAPTPRLSGHHSAAVARHRAPDTQVTLAQGAPESTLWLDALPAVIRRTSSAEVTTAPRPLPAADRPSLVDGPGHPVGEGFPERRALPEVPAPCPIVGAGAAAEGSLVSGRSTRDIIDTLLSAEQMGAALLRAGSEMGPDSEQMPRAEVNPVAGAQRLRVSSSRVPEIASARDRLPLPDRERGLLPRHTSLPPRPAEGMTSVVAAVAPDASTCMATHTVRGTRCVHGLGHLPLTHQDMFGQEWGHGASRARRAVSA